jgi:hypothetical protein
VKFINQPHCIDWVAMLSGLEESSITQLLQILWRGRGALGNSSVTEDIQIGLSIPHTVVYEHNFPKGLFHAGLDGNLMRRVGKEIDSKIVFRVFSESEGPKTKSKSASGGVAGAARNVPGTPSRDPTGESDIVAVYTEKGEDNMYSAQYFTDAALRAFLLGSTAEASPASSSLASTSASVGNGATASTTNPDLVDLRPVASKNGILQKFIYPVGPHNEMIQVLWTPHVCIAEKLRSCMLLGDVTKTPFQRAATIEGPANFNTRAYVSPATAESIRLRCESLVDQLYVVERRLVSCMTLYFKVDEHGNLWLLWCAYLRFLPQKTALSTSRPASVAGRSKGGHTINTPQLPTASMVPRFVLPRSCAGDFAGRAALFLAKNDTAQRPNKPILGADDKDMQAVYHVTHDMSFESLTEDTVLKRPFPVLSQRCLTPQHADAVFVPPTKSRLCPKMRWLRGPLTFDYQRRTQFDVEADDHHRSQRVASSSAGTPGAGQSMTQYNKAEPSLFTVGTPVMSRTPSPALNYPSSHNDSTNGGLPAERRYSMRDLSVLMSKQAKAKAPTSAIDILRSPLPKQLLDGDSVSQHTAEPDASAVVPFHSLCDSPPRRRALESLTSTQCDGDLRYEMMLLRQLCREAVHPAILRKPSHFVERMVAVKTSLEVVAQFLTQLRDASATHFSLFPTIPSLGVVCPTFAFSVPISWIESDVVVKALMAMLASCPFEAITMEEAVRIDKAAGRGGYSDHCSWHHHVLAQQRLAEAHAHAAQAQPAAVAADSPNTEGGAEAAEPQGDASGAEETEKGDDQEVKASPPAEPLEAPAPPAATAVDDCGTIPCFRILDSYGQTKLLSKIPQFITVTLRTIHSDVERSLCG